MIVCYVPILLQSLCCVTDSVLLGLGGGVGFSVNHNIQFKIVDTPTYTSFENIIMIGYSARPFCDSMC